MCLICKANSIDHLSDASVLLSKPLVYQLLKIKQRPCRNIKNEINSNLRTVYAHFLLLYAACILHRLLPRISDHAVQTILSCP